jgi:hypothetical protein
MLRRVLTASEGYQKDSKRKRRSQKRKATQAKNGNFQGKGRGVECSVDVHKSKNQATLILTD